MTNKIKKLEVTVDRIVFQSEGNSFKVIRTTSSEDSEEKITAVGEMPEVYEGQDLVLEGVWVHHDRYGRQFQVKKCMVSAPTTKKGVKKYLASDLIKGVGEKYAERIVNKFGEETLDIIEKNPDFLLNVDGIGEKRLDQILESWEQQKEIRDVMIALKSHDISTAYGLRIYEKYGSQAQEIVKRDPYRLASDVDGIGFMIADRIAQKVGIDQEDPGRIKAGLRYTLRESSNDGHIYLPWRVLVEKAVELLDLPQGLVEGQLEKLLDEGGLITTEESEATDGKPVYLPFLYYAEQEVAEKLAVLDSFSRPESGLSSAHISELIDGSQMESGLEYNEEQQAAIRTALMNKVAVITGGPGTGKTTVITGMIAIMEKLGWDITLAAPTGRAAKRLTETTGREAKTIHRTLGYKPPGTFTRNEENQLPTDVVIIDELSMVDLRLINHLLRAIPVGSHLVLVGDADQLPSVGPGDVINDIINSGVISLVELTRIYRQSRTSDIVKNAHRINKGKYPVISNKDGADFFFFEESNPVDARKKIIKLVASEIPDKWDMDPLEDIQVLSPMYKGLCGVNMLNRKLQAKLNDNTNLDSSTVQSFRVGDKVMQTENDYDKGVFNGDIGKLVNFDRSTEELEVQFSDYGVINYKKDEATSLDLAYAITIHKSQGSEYEGVVLPILNQHFVMLKRNLLYTAVTRSRRLVVLVGSKRAAGIAINNDKETRRYSALAEELRESEKRLSGN